MDDLRRAYDLAATEYARRLYDELSGKPFDRARLDAFGERQRGRGEICDLGCGPGHVAARLFDAGLQLLGVDLSPEMVAEARRRRPDIPFEVADMLALPFEERFAGIVAFYSIVNLQTGQVERALAQMQRALVPGGELLLAFHIGVQTVDVEDWWGTGARLRFVFHDPEQVREVLERVGFQEIDVATRGPYAESVEGQTERAYINARRREIR